MLKAIILYKNNYSKYKNDFINEKTQKIEKRIENSMAKSIEEGSTRNSETILKEKTIEEESIDSDSEPSIDNLDKDDLEKLLPTEPKKKKKTKKKKNLLFTKTTKIVIKEELKIEKNNRNKEKNLIAKNSSSMFSSTKIENTVTYSSSREIPKERNLMIQDYKEKKLESQKNINMNLTKSLEIKNKFIIVDIKKRDMETQTEEIFFQM